ncbi:glycosyltransferase family A protein [Argonema antarcticum]|uniref:glycosyltransferase family A protein n=1 Tax=Argonema antarcticum TaxID=2942763 RepID=UPI0020125CD0|nr:glycosyltransferase family A protein [Argonema antarcticum]MCL1473010.1 glycosyltransferase family 2 protein [Argonema antarcticum A004/B2]
MLVFVIPLKSPKVSKSWELVSKLLERTLKSVCNQTSSDFRVIVVCHQKPQIEFNHPHITYIEVDFPIPGQDYQSKSLDKGRKILHGLFYAREFNPSHTMVVDADDCVSKHLAKFVTQNPQSNGWFFNPGYVYQTGKKLIYFRKKAFNKLCGTSNIIRYDLHKLPDDINQDYPELNKYYDNHSHVEDQMVKRGNPLEPLPFIGAIYIIGNQENIYLQGDSMFMDKNKDKGILWKIKYFLNYRLFTKSIREEFGFYDMILLSNITSEL